MEIADHPTIRSVANIKPELLPLFKPIERVVIEVCMNLVKENDKTKMATKMNS